MLEAAELEVNSQLIYSRIICFGQRKKKEATKQQYNVCVCVDLSNEHGIEEHLLSFVWLVLEFSCATLAKSLKKVADPWLTLITKVWYVQTCVVYNNYR